MSINRRKFLQWVGISGLGLYARGCVSPEPAAPPSARKAPPVTEESEASWALADPRGLCAAALRAARKGGASYADVRLVRIRRQGLVVRDRSVAATYDSDDQGMGVRVIVGGRWGFAALPRLTELDAEAAAAIACEIAKANGKILGPPVKLAPVQGYTDRWTSPVEVDPFAVSLEEKAALFLEASEAAFSAGASFVFAGVDIIREHKYFASTEGSFIEQTLTRTSPSFSVTVVDSSQGEFEDRDIDIAPMLAGYEHVTGARLKENAPRLVEECKEKLKAPAVSAGVQDLIIDPTNLWLTIHESVGHPTELDRAMGFEANFAGTSFCTPDKLRKLKYGSDLISIYADRTTPKALATCAYDDEGVKTSRFDIIRDGLFVGYQTTREQAAWIGEKESRGCSYADSWDSVQFQRMPNVSLEPGKDQTTLDDLIADTKNGLYLVGTGSWSIDQQRYNFQFTCQMAYQIKDGKRVGAVRHAGYQANSVDFWNSCDGLGGPDTWWMGGSFYDGKGEPGQINSVSHGCPVARFRGVNVINARLG